LFFYCLIEYSIDLVSETKISYQRVYNCFREQTQVIKIYIDNILEKKFIRRSQSDYVLFVFIVKKSEKDFRVCINYRALNVFTIKNRNILSLIRNILVRLYIAKFYIKFDIIAVFNKICIRKSDKNKIAFIIYYSLFEYVIIFFELYNASDIFQIFINKIFREYLNDFCIVYLNNIFIYSNIQEKYIRYIKLVLIKLKQTELYLNIDKYKFNIIQIKYLNFIIIIEEIKIDFEKIKIIQK